MKNWETKEFHHKFVKSMDCPNCPVNNKSEINNTCKALNMPGALVDSKECMRSFIDYAMKEATPVVKKMTMQEWANVTGLPAAKGANGKVLLYPFGKIEKIDNSWYSAEGNGNIDITDRVTDAEEHDWTIPCYPEGNENE